MFTRHLVSQLTERLNEPRRFIQIVAGPRQMGKTTAVVQALEKINTPRHFVSALAKAGEALLVIDEIQKVGGWSSIVKLLWDEDTRLRVNLKVIKLVNPRLCRGTPRV
jgi:predicted AAA+ superfamily ATPase